LIDKDSQIAGCVHPELDESFRRSWAGRPAIAPSCPGPGTVKDDIVASLDWLPTLVDIAGADKGDALNKRIMAGSYPGIVKTKLACRPRPPLVKTSVGLVCIAGPTSGLARPKR
jgi:hypothetical protein